MPDASSGGAKPVEGRQTQPILGPSVEETKQPDQEQAWLV
jgi:hypothetical protein